MCYFALKDKRLQAELDAKTGGDLTRQFRRDDWIRLTHEGDEHLGIIYYGPTVGKSNVRQFSLVFKEDDLIEVEE